MILLFLPYSGVTTGTMKTLFLIFVFALTTVALEVYSDAMLTNGEVSRAVPDPATLAIAHALKHS